MKEYVAVPDALLHKTRELQRYFGLSYDYAKNPQAKSHKEAIDVNIETLEAGNPSLDR